MGTNVYDGTSPDMMGDFGRTHLPVRSYGAENYQGGLAIALVMDPFDANEEERVEHYVTLLGREQDHLRFYCPYVGDSFVCRESDFPWSDRGGDLGAGWSMNFETPYDLSSLSVRGEARHVLIEESIEMM